MWGARGILQCYFLPIRLGRGEASRGLEPLFWTCHHMTSGPRPSWECWLQLPAESWHQEALPGEMPGHRWGSAYAHGPQLSSLRAGLGRAGPWPQHLSESRGTSNFSPSLLAWPSFWLSRSLPLFPHFNVVTILKPCTAAAAGVEGHTCRRCPAPPFICRATSLPLLADGNGPGPMGAPQLTGHRLWCETLKTRL